MPNAMSPRAEARLGVKALPSIRSPASRPNTRGARGIRRGRGRPVRRSRVRIPRSRTDRCVGTKTFRARDNPPVGRLAGKQRYRQSVTRSGVNRVGVQEGLQPTAPESSQARQAAARCPARAHLDQGRFGSHSVRFPGSTTLAFYSQQQTSRVSSHARPCPLDSIEFTA
jgi:hypothetical protein